jgi:hypothetical protein
VGKETEKDLELNEKDAADVKGGIVRDVTGKGGNVAGKGGNVAGKGGNVAGKGGN